MGYYETCENSAIFGIPGQGVFGSSAPGDGSGSSSFQPAQGHSGLSRHLPALPSSVSRELASPLPLHTQLEERGPGLRLPVWEIGWAVLLTHATRGLGSWGPR